MTSTRRASTPAGLAKEDATVQPGTQILLVVVLVLVGASFALWKLPDGTSLYLIAPLQVLLGSAIFIALILLVVLAFARLGLYDRGSALALPDGSIRALIALILLIIFIIFANVIFGNLTGHTTSRVESFSGLSQEQVNHLPGQVQTVAETPATDTRPATLTGTYVITEPSKDAAALGQQVVTGLLTLVAAISAFYFGSGSVTAGAAALRQGASAGPPDLRVLRPSQPVGLGPDDAGGLAPLEIELGGTALDAGGVTGAVVANDPTGTVARGVTDSQFTYTPGEPVDPVTLRFTSNADAGATVDLVVHLAGSGAGADAGVALGAGPRKPANERQAPGPAGPLAGDEASPPAGEVHRGGESPA